MEQQANTINAIVRHERTFFIVVQEPDDFIAVVLSEICKFVPEKLEDLVQSGSDKSTEDGADPVNPEVARETAIHNVWPQGSSRIDATAGVVDSYILSAVALYFITSKCEDRRRLTTQMTNK